MKDRESTQILDNGAVRYGIYDSDGVLQRYEYIKLEDEPTVTGSLYNKANVLPDSVCELLDIPIVSEPKDAFAKLRDIVKKSGTSDYERFVFGRFF